MKKILYLLTIICSFVLINEVNAYELDADDVERGTYIIGTHMFNREKTDNYDGTLTLEHIMLGAQTIQSNNLEDMKIYLKNSRGVWVNPDTNETYSSVPTTFTVEYENMDIYVPIPSAPIFNGNSYVQDDNGKNIYRVYYYFDDYQEYENIVDGIEVYKTIDGVETFHEEYEIGNIPKEHWVETQPNTTVKVRTRFYILDESNNKKYSDYSEYVTSYVPALPELTLTQKSIETDELGNKIITIETNEIASDETVEILYYETTSQTPNYDTAELISLGKFEGEKGIAELTVINGQKVYILAQIAKTEKFGLVGDTMILETSKWIYVDNSLSTPTLNYNRNSIDDLNDLADITLSVDSLGTASGMEIYSSNTIDGQYDLLATVASSVYSTTETITNRVFYKIKTYYTTDNNQKYYSDFSNIVTDGIENIMPQITVEYMGEGIEDNIEILGLTVNNLDAGTGFELYRSTSLEGEYELVTSSTEEYYAIQQPLDGTYYYKIRLYETVDEETKYSKYAYYPTTLNTPTLQVEYNGGNGEIESLGFSVDSLNSATGMAIYQSDSLNGTYKLVKKVENLTTPIIAQVGSSNYYKVRLYKNISDGVIYSDYSNIYHYPSSAMLPLNKPEYTTEVIESDTTKTVTVNVSNLGTADGVEIYKRLNVDPFYELIVENEGNVVSIELPLDNSEYYCVRLYKVIDGNKVYSNYSTEIFN